MGTANRFSSRDLLKLSAGAVLVSMGLIQSNAKAADFTWDSTLTGAQSWNVDVNWQGTGIPDFANDGMPITNADNANVQVGLGANLNIDIGAADTTVQQILLGGTAGAVTTQISSTGGNLVLGGTSVLTSGGVAGSVNTISAPIRMDANVAYNVASTENLTLSGNIGQINGARTLNNNRTSGTLTLGTLGSTTIDLFDALVPATARNITINTAAGGTTVINSTFNRGTSTGNVLLGSGITNVPTATFRMNADNTAYLGTVQTNKQRYILAANNAFGMGATTASNNNNANWGTEYQSDNDARTMANMLIMGNSMAFTGPNSLTWTGTVTQGNNRIMGNTLVAGKTLTLAGDGTAVIPAIAISRVVGDGNRTWVIEGTGTTIVSGVVVNNFTDDTVGTNIVGALTKRGTGRAELNNALNTIRGAISANGGMLAFGADGSWGTTTGINAATNGGITYTPGIADAGFVNFGAKLNPASSGYYALKASESGSNVDMNAGPMSVAPGLAIAGDGNYTYTGIVTPHATGGYNWGGFNSTLTLGANASTGAFNVTYKNGGTIALTGTQDYTGNTTINGANLATSQAGIATQSGSSSTTVNTFYSTVLLADQLAAAGSPSSIGAGPSAATGLVLSGGTLRYVGSSSTSTDRLFTVSNAGATIEANGVGTATLGSAGGLNVSSGTGARTLTLRGTNTGDNTIGSVLADGTLVTDTLAVTKSDAGTWKLSGQNTHTGNTSVTAGLLKLGAGFKGTPTLSSAMSISNGAKVEVLTNGTAASVTRIKSLNTNTSGFLELHDNDLVLDYTGGATSYTATVNQVKAGLTLLGGAGTTGIGSADVDAQTVSGTILAVVDDGDPNIAGGITGLSGYAIPNPLTSVLVKYTWFGDANLDGSVDGSDYALTDTGFTSGGALGGWVFGDYDYSGTIDGGDYALQDTGFIAQTGALPEPATLGLLGLGAMGMLRRRRQA